MGLEFLNTEKKHFKICNNIFITWVLGINEYYQFLKLNVKIFVLKKKTSKNSCTIMTWCHTTTTHMYLLK